MNKIEQYLVKNNKLKIMTHIVAGYPSLDINVEMVKIMQESGVSIVEIQIPFSDPMADGSTIMKANQYAITQEIKVIDCFNLVEKLNKVISIPLIFMSYVNIPYRIGFEKFIQLSSNVGISGFIIPDMPFDEEIDNFLNISKSKNLYTIQVISPDIQEDRLNRILEIADGFIYYTLKVGITGVQDSIKKDSIKFLNFLKTKTQLPIACGFGISNINQVQLLKNSADIIVIGSHLINIFDQKGLNGIEDFLLNLNKNIS